MPAFNAMRAPELKMYLASHGEFCDNQCLGCSKKNLEKAARECHILLAPEEADSDVVVQTVEMEPPIHVKADSAEEKGPVSEQHAEVDMKALTNMLSEAKAKEQRKKQIRWQGGPGTAHLEGKHDGLFHILEGSSLRSAKPLGEHHHPRNK